MCHMSIIAIAKVMAFLQPLVPIGAEGPHIRFAFANSSAFACYEEAGQPSVTNLSKAT